MTMNIPPAQPEQPLGALQQWLMSAITAPQGLTGGLDSARQLHGWHIGDVITAAADADPRRGLDVYASGYWLRLLACLQSDYPALRRHLGEQLFNFFCRAYLQQHPSRSYSLYDLGSEFARFLRHTQSAAARAGNDLRFPLELALLEHARNVSRRAEGLEACVANPHEAGRALLMEHDTGLTLPGSTSLLLTTHPLTAFQPWLDGGGAEDAPAIGTGYIAVARKNFQVSFHALTNWQYYALCASRRQPRSLAYCASAAARRCHRPMHELMAQLSLWLPAAQTAGLLKLTAASHFM